MGERLDDTRARLLEAAGEVFAEKGFQAATVREICKRAEANVAAVNYYFGDKQRLYVEVLRYAHRGIAERGEPPYASEMTPEEKLRTFIEHLLADMQDDGTPAWRRRLMLRELTEPSETEACLAAMHAFIQPRKEALGKILSEILPPETSELDRQLIAFSIVGQCMFHRIHWPVVKLMAGETSFRSLDLTRLTDHISRFCLAALGYGPPIVEPAKPARATA